ncbi:cation-efflux pump [Rhodobacterales bacterium 52_120_T64]|nr:cation-efflux pump [Rhodobacterales bacterium 52_120_T64]
MELRSTNGTWFHGTGTVVLTNLRLNLTAGGASVLVAILLVALKLWALSETGSLSIAASLTDSALDLIVSLTGVMAIIYAARPADEDHAFGHSSAEDLAALAQAILVTVSGLVIGWSAIERLLSDTPAPLAAEGRGILVMFTSVVITGALVLWQRHVARRTGSKVVAADSLHYLSDLLPNFGAIAALAASSAFGMTSVDSIIALAAALFLLFSAWRIGGNAFDALMDRRADPVSIAKVENIVASWPNVLGYHDLKTRTAGNRIFVQVHIELDGDQTLEQAHGVSAGLKREILRIMPNADVIIHKDPAGDPLSPNRTT